MLSVYDGERTISRRRLLTAGSLALGGLTLSHLLGTQALAARARRELRDKSVILLFQQGGPSQFETFDPKPEAPQSTRTVTGVTQTSVPGVQFGETLERLSKLAHKLTVIRSFQTNNAGHNIQPIVGPDLSRCEHRRALRQGGGDDASQFWYANECRPLPTVG